jgi:hypothetical protein
MNKLQISIPVEFVSLGLGSKAKAKAMKAKPVLRLLGDERLLFSNSCEGLEEIYTELEQFTGTSEDSHDDIVSALSLLADQFQGYAEMGTKLEGISVDYVSNQQAKEIHDLIYHMGKYAHLNEAHQVIDDNPVTQFQMQNIPQLSSAGSYQDPLSDLMG